MASSAPRYAPPGSTAGRPARRAPRPSRNVTFHPSAASARPRGSGPGQSAACRTRRPGSPDWDVSATAAGRAMWVDRRRVVDREGSRAWPVGSATPAPPHPDRDGRARRRTARAGPRPRAQTARVSSRRPLSYADVAFASGFSSVRQFNDTLRGSRLLADRAARPPWRPGDHRTVPCDWASARRSPVGRCGLPRLPPRPRGRGWRTRLVRPPSTCRTVPGRCGSSSTTCRRPRPRSSPPRSELADLRDTGAGRADPPSPGRRLRPARGRRALAGDPVVGASRARLPGPAGPGAGGRRRDSGPGGRRAAGERRQGVHRHRSHRRRPRSPGVDLDAGPDHLFPDAATLAVVDPRPADATGAGPGAGGSLRPHWPTARSPWTGARPRRRAIRAAGPTRRRSLDG